MTSQFIEVFGSKMHYFEEGEGDPILFVHGNPTSSYLWRNVIPHVQGVGRCIALDLIGMGKSDKPEIEYRLVDHIKYFEGFIKAMGLKNITLVLHDWGSALGLHYAMRHEENVKGIVMMESILQTYSWKTMPFKLKLIFGLFRAPFLGKFLACNLNLFLKEVLSFGVVRKLSKDEVNAYESPFPSAKDRKPIHSWVLEVPIDEKPADVTEIINVYCEKLQESELPKLLLYAKPGAVIGKKKVLWCQEHLKNLSIEEVGKGLHFIQEDTPQQVGTKIAEWFTKQMSI